ncbi:MAG: hypothetical protein IJV87_10720 [Clostridia bacterium]|nr:hypothetical protein [Clostridia bacterium]
MNKKDKLKLDLLSNIKDEIIDKQSEKRYKLMTSKRRRFPKWIIPTGAAAAIFIAALIPILILLFSKQVPIYEGMTVLENFDGSTAKAAPSYRIDMLTSTDNNGNHYGHDKKPISDIVEEDPTISLTVPEQQMYYADPGQDIYINIHISNPDNFVILSFMLNGKTYSSYMFEEGSDMENIVLKVNVGDAAGVVEYTIDAIKYVDGTQIKDVIMEGDRTVKVGVYSEGIQPEASITNELVGINEISFTASLSDKYNLIERSGGKAYAILFGEENIIAYKELTAEETEIVFDGLDTSTSYRYGIVAYYDSLDGNGLSAQVMLEKEFTTQSVVAIEGVNVDQTGIDFGVIFNEAFESKALSSMTLYHGEEKVKEFDVSGDITQRTFSAAELLSNNTYRLVLTYENLGQTETVEFELTTEAKATPEIEITTPTKTQTSVSFEITETDTDSVGAVTKIELVHANGTIEAKSLEAREFADLLSNNEYTVKITYTYDLNDGIGEQTIVKELAITTDAKAKPDVKITENSKTQTSIKFDVAVADVDSVGEITKLELIHGEDVQNITDLDTREFTDLLSNNKYTVKVTYTYDLNDGIGEQTIVKELAITTEAKTAPSFEVKNETITTAGIDASYDIADVDNILSYYKVELYKGETLVSENEAKKISFTSLDYYTDYTVRITYKYDLNDGNGEQTATYDYKFKTLPYIDVTDCKIANTGAVSEGETIFMQVKLDNPLGMSVESVVVNGETYAVTGSSTTNKIFVEIVYNGQFDGGDTYLKVDKVKAKIDNTTLTVEPETELSDNVFINGKLEVLKIEFVNDDFEPIDWAFPSETVYVMITLDNPTGYTVDRLDEVYADVDLIKLDDNHWYFAVEIYEDHYGWYDVSLTGLTYSNEYITKSIIYSDMICHFFRLKSDEIRYISTPDELKITGDGDGYYYELTNDIDLSGIEWIGSGFHGVLDGKGHSIENMSFVGTIKNANACLGLFRNGCGIIQNLNIKEATIIAEVTSDDGGSYSVSCGAFIGVCESYNLILDNCTVDEYSVLTVKNSVAVASVGGLIGFGNATITNCSNAGSISVTGSVVYTGGLIGDGRAAITNCSNAGSISVTGSIVYTGGLIGDGRATITNCSNAGSISATGSEVWSGGLIGCSRAFITIINSTNNGDVTATGTTKWSGIGGLIGLGFESMTVINCDNNGNITATNVADIFNAGGIIGYVDGAGSTSLTNCNNSGDMVIENTSIVYSAARVGGILGGSYNDQICTVKNCINSGNVNVSNSESSVGGLIGWNESGNMTVDSCANSGNVTATNGYAGGIVGNNYATITNCTNNGNVTAGGATGGIVGYNEGSGSISDCVNSGSVADTVGYTGGIAGYNFGTITNSYSLTSGDGVNGKSCTVDQLNSKEFYTETLGWSEDVWDFSELDIINGKYPGLKG